MGFVEVSRRELFLVLGGGAVLAACSENPAIGRSQLMLVPEAALAELGEAAWRDALSQMPRVADARMQARLAGIGERVAAASDLGDAAWEFVVFDRPEVNAFVLPGGKVGFFRGLMEVAASDDEIAAVASHEVAHIAARHSAERLSQQMAVKLGVSLASAALSEEYGQNAEAIAAALGAGALYGVILPYSRKQELEADALGVDLMRRAAFDPGGALSFWRRMASDGPRAVEWLSTHPADARRLDRLSAIVNAPAMLGDPT